MLAHSLPTTLPSANLATVLSKVKRTESGCVIWTGAVFQQDGRPRVWLGGKSEVVYTCSGVEKRDHPEWLDTASRQIPPA